MKKLLFALFVGLLAIGMMATGVVFAQSATPTPTVASQTAQIAPPLAGPGRGGHMGKHDDGPLRTYFEQALAQKLGITNAELQEKLTAGQHPKDIVAATGIATADIPAYMLEVRKTALANAVTAGVITQAQADEMAQRQPGGPKGNHANSPIHTYFEQALAQKLGITDAELQEKLTAGQRPEEIVAATGVATADIPAYMLEVRKTALANAVTAGVITQAQADEMLQHMQHHPNGGGRRHRGEQAPDTTQAVPNP